MINTTLGLSGKKYQKEIAELEKRAEDLII